MISRYKQFLFYSILFYSILFYSTSVVAVAARAGRHSSDGQLAMSTAVVSVAQAEVGPGAGRKTSSVVPARTSRVSAADLRVRMLTAQPRAT